MTLKCTTPGCRKPGVVTKTSIARNGRKATKVLCEQCDAGRTKGLFAKRRIEK